MKNDLCARCWEAMEQSASNEDDDRTLLRMKFVRKLRALMAEYQGALLRQSRVLDLQNPASRSLNGFNEWLGKNRPLVSHSYALLDTQEEDELVALRMPPDQDRLTSFFQDYAGLFFTSNKRDGHEWEGITYFPDTALHAIVSVLSVIITAALLVGALVALTFANTQSLKLGLIALFTTAFAAGVGLLTNARKAELYAATAA